MAGAVVGAVVVGTSGEVGCGLVAGHKSGLQGSQAAYVDATSRHASVSVPAIPSDKANRI